MEVEEVPVELKAAHIHEAQNGEMPVMETQVGECLLEDGAQAMEAEEVQVEPKAADVHEAPGREVPVDDVQNCETLLKEAQVGAKAEELQDAGAQAMEVE